MDVQAATASPASDPESIVSWVGKRRHVEHERLRAALLDAERRMSAAKSCGKDIAPFRRCLKIAHDEAVESRFFVAWDNIHQFDIEYLATLDEEGRLVAWRELNAEAHEKLQGWRAIASKTLQELGDDKQAPSAQRLVAVRTQLATQSQNSWQKREMLHRRVPITLFGSAATIAFFLATAALGWYEPLVPGLIGPLLLGVLAAILGGMISVATSIGTADLQAKIPQLGFTIAITTLRPVIGALCAIPVVFLVYSGFLKVGDLSPLRTSVILCLITGFSERWFLNLMDSVRAETKR